MGDYSGAIKACDEALRINPKMAIAHIARGAVRQRTLREYPGAIEDYSRALVGKPDPVILTSRGTLRAMTRDLAGARKDYDEAIQLDPNYAPAYLNRGLVRNVEGDTDGAIGDFSKAIELNPRIPEAWLNRGLVRQRKGDPKAAEDFEKCLEVAPADWPHRDHAKRLLEEAKRP
jgi:tetratricopeptide (TPR) repeat protein